MATHSDVEKFLAVFRRTIEASRCHPRKPAEFEQDLADLGITQAIALSMIKRLTADNYSAGPETDETDRTREVWVFGTRVAEREVYVKLRHNPVPTNAVGWGIIWSFHEAGFPMKYPLRKKAT